MSDVPGPAALPECEHGRVDFEHCSECNDLRRAVQSQVKPLADEFWDTRGMRNIENLLVRAFYMGRRSRSRVRQNPLSKD